LYDYGARFYDPALGRFISADTVVPGAGNPQALNRYAYVLNNPLKYTDPTGHQGEEPRKGTKEWYEWYFANYGIMFTGADWGINDYKIVYAAIQRVEAAFRKAGYDPEVAKAALGIGGDRKLTFNKITTGSSNADTPANTINFRCDDDPFKDEVETAVHEMGHIIDWHARPDDSPWGWSASTAEWRSGAGWRRHHEHDIWLPTAEGPMGAPTINARGNPGEDFADTFTWWVYAQSGGRFSRAIGIPSQSRQITLSLALTKFR